jgi:hypothetical protein
MTSLNTIAEAFTAWTSIKAQLAETNNDTFSLLAQKLAKIERPALLLPVQTAQTCCNFSP